MGKSFILEKGQKFGKLTVIKLSNQVEYKSPNGRKLLKKYYLCKCECGNETIVYQGKLTSGQTKSCGCITHKHNLYNSRIYNIYRGMKKRCSLVSDKDYKNYGARGIKLCKEWEDDFLSFYNWAINNGYKDNLTIDRIDVNGNYKPSNCRWLSNKKQANNRRTNQVLFYKNEKHTITEWAEILNIPRSKIYQRLYAGWSINEALSGSRTKNAN